MVAPSIDRPRVPRLVADRQELEENRGGSSCPPRAPTGSPEVGYTLRLVVASAQQFGGDLTPAQLRRELKRISWGTARLAEKLGVWPTEVRDWLAGKEPVPEVVASDIRHIPSAT